MKKISLRIRLITSFICIASIVWLIAAFLSWKESRDEIYEFFDSYQLLLARQLSAADWTTINAHSQKKSNTIIDKINNVDDEDEALGFAIFNDKGKMIFNDDKNGAKFPYNPVTGLFINQNIIGEEEPWRIIWVKSADDKFSIAVGQELEYRDDIALEMVEESLLPWLLGLSLLTFATVIMVSLEFIPLKKLAKDLSEREANDLSPIINQNIPKEILPLIRAINQLFGQIEQMIGRERNFIADSAHELRTPLTALKIQLEVAKLAQDDENTRNKALNQLELGIERSARLVEQLLALSRIEASSNQYENSEIINWHKLLEQIIEEQKKESLSKNIEIKFTIEATPPIKKGNQILLMLLFRNLLDNAIRYSPNNAQISIILDEHKIAMTNSDTIVDKKHIEHLSKRFYRPAGQKESGSGLGLSIVTRIAKIYNCSISFSNTPQGFCVTLTPSKTL